MPAGIAVNISHAKLNTQEKSASQGAEKKNSLKKSDSGGEKDVLKPDFKKLVDEKNGKNGEKAAVSSADRKVSAGSRKKASALKPFSGVMRKGAGNPGPDTEKLSEKQPEKSGPEELKNGNTVSFTADLKKETAEAADKSAEKNSRLVSFSAVSGGLHSQDRTVKKAEEKAESDISRIRNSGKKDPGKNESLQKDNVKLQVLDLRTAEKSGEKAENSFQGSENSSEKFDLLSENSEGKTDSSQNQVRDALFIKAEPLTGDKPETSVKSLTAQQTAVLEKLKNDGNSEIVRQTKMILNDNNSGELRMVLKPERLGFVRIKLNLDDNNIVGRIIVDNNSIKEIFENNMENLLRNFRESGFSSASLEVSVGGGKNRQQNMDSNERFFSKKIIEDVDSHNIVNRGPGSINAETLIDLVV